MSEHEPTGTLTPITVAVAKRLLKRGLVLPNVPYETDELTILANKQRTLIDLLMAVEKKIMNLTESE